MPPTVSVIIPTYRRPALMREAVETVLAQTFEDFECIVVDDGSGDATESTVAELSQRDRRVRFLGLSHAGKPGRSRNEGLAVAQAKWVAFLDDDDLWLPEKLGRQLEWLKAHPELSLVCSRIEEFGDRSALWPDGAVPARLDLNTMARGNMVATSTVVAVRQTLLDLGGFDASLPRAQDYDLWLRLARKHELGFMDEVLCRYRVHATNISADRPIALQCLERTLQRSFAEGDLSSREFRRRLRAIHGERMGLSRGREKLYWLLRRELARFVTR